MINAILYSSCTGSCKKYAQLMSQATGVPAYDVKNFTASKPKTEVAYVGWLFAGFIMGLKKAKKKAKVKAVCQVGMGPDMPALEGIARKKNAIVSKKVPVMYFQGSFNINKLPLPLKLIMKKKTQEIAGRLEGKARSAALNAQEQATLKMATTGAGEPAAWDVSAFTAWFNANK